MCTVGIQMVIWLGNKYLFTSGGKEGGREVGREVGRKEGSGEGGGEEGRR